MLNGGRFDFDDGGTYCGGWEDGKAHGHGVCTGPKGQGEYSGAWHYGFEVSGVYMWPSGNNYEGQWQNGKRHGLGVERRGRWTYRGEWTQGYKGRYGVRHSTNSQAKYEGTWANGLQDGYGVETYADGGTYQGQWLRGMRHGYGIRKSAPYGVAAKYRSRSHAHASLTSLRSDQSEEGNEKDGKKTMDESRGGFVLRARSEPPSRRRSLSERSVVVKRTILQGLRIKKQRSTGDIDQRVTGGTGSLRSSGSTVSCASDESAGTGFASSHDHGSFIGTDEFVDPNAVESYVGEWKNDKRSGFGVSERSDGLKYEGEWFNNKKYGYGVTTFKDGTKEEGKYKNNVLVTSQRKKNLLFVRTSKLRERIDNAVGSAQRATQIALQKADIGISRSGTAHERADQADVSAVQAREDAEIARIFAKQLSPDFNQNAFESIKKPRLDLVNHIGALQSGRNYIGGGGMQDGQHHIIPKPHHPITMTSLDNDPTTMSNSLSPDVTPPMMTPPQEVPYRVQMAGGGVPLGLSNAQHQQQLQMPKLLQQNQPYVYQSAGPTTYPYAMSMQQQQQISAAAQQQQRQQQMQKQSSLDHQQHQQQQQQIARPTALSDRQQQQGGGGRQGQQQMANAVDHRQYAMAKFAQPQRSMDFADADAYTHRTNRLSPTLSRSGSESGGSRHSVNQMMNDFYEQYSTSGSRHRHQQDQQYNDDGSPMSPGGGLIRRSTLGSARDCKKLQQQGFRYENLEPSTSAAQPAITQHRPSTSAAAQHRPSSAVMHGRDIAHGPGGQQTMSGVRLKTPMVKQFSQHHDAGAEGPRGSVPDLTELVKTPVQMTREEIARLSSQRRQELQRLNEDNELLRDNPLRYLRYLFHPSVKAWLIRWKLPLLVLLVNVGLSVIFCQLLTYSNLDKEDLDDND